MENKNNSNNKINECNSDGEDQSRKGHVFAYGEEGELVQTRDGRLPSSRSVSPVQRDEALSLVHGSAQQAAPPQLRLLPAYHPGRW